MISELDDCISRMAKDHNNLFLPGTELNRKLKLLSFYLVEMLKNPEEHSSINTNNLNYLKYKDEHFEKALGVLGFSRENELLNFTGDLAVLSENKGEILELLFKHRYFSLAEVSELIGRGEKPPGIREINDSPIEAPHSSSRLERPRKPWE